MNASTEETTITEANDVSATEYHDSAQQTTIDLHVNSEEILATHSAYPFASVVCVTSSIGLIFNIVIIVTFSISTKLRSPQNLFIVNLGVADFFMCFWPVIQIYAIFSEKKEAVYGPIVCELFAIAVACPSFSSIIFIGAIGFSRYISICHPQKKNTILSRRNCIIISLVIWLYIFLLILIGYTKDGLAIYLPKMVVCGLNFTIKPVINIILILSSYTNVYVVILVSYVKIYIEYHQSKRRVDGVEGSKKISKNEFKLAVSLIVIFLIYNICLGPIYTLPLIDPAMTLPTALYEFVLAVLYCNSCANFPLYMYFNVVFRNEVLRIFCMKKFTATK